MTDNRTPSDVLNEVADMFEADRDAWIQGSYIKTFRVRDGIEFQDKPCFCAIGAIAEKACGNAWGAGNLDEHPLAFAAVAQLSAHLVSQRILTDETLEGRVINWNDMYGRTVQEIIDQTRAAAVTEARARDEEEI